MSLFRSRTHKQFVQAFRNVRLDAHDYTFQTEYVSSRTPITIKHVVCGNIFETRPHALLKKGKKCPYCQLKRPQKELTKEQLASDIIRYRQFEYSLIENQYSDETNSLRIRHDVCGQEFVISHRSMLRYGLACPTCGIRDLEKLKSSLYADMKHLNQTMKKNPSEHEYRRFNLLVCLYVLEGSFGRFMVLTDMDINTRTFQVLDRRSGKRALLTYEALMKKVREIVQHHGHIQDQVQQHSSNQTEE